MPSGCSSDANHSLSNYVDNTKTIIIHIVTWTCHRYDSGNFSFHIIDLEGQSLQLYGAGFRKLKNQVSCRVKFQVNMFHRSSFQNPWQLAILRQFSTDPRISVSRSLGFSKSTLFKQMSTSATFSNAPFAPSTHNSQSCSHSHSAVQCHHVQPINTFHECNVRHVFPCDQYSHEAVGGGTSCLHLSIRDAALSVLYEPWWNRARRCTP